MPNLRQSYVQNIFRPISGVFIALVLLIIGVAGYLGLASTTITITPLLMPVSTNFDVTIGPGDNQDNYLTGTVTITERSATVTTTPVQGEATVPAHASGTVTIYNKTNRDQPLTTGTRLRSNNNIIVRTTSRVDVPANSSVDVQVLADPLGAEGNLPPGRFVIVALWPATQEKIYGESKTAFTGGLTTGGNTLSLDRLTDASNQAQQQIVDEFGPSTPGKYHWLAPVAVTTDPKPEIPSDSYSVTVKVKAYEIAYSATALDQLIRQNLSADLADGVKLNDFGQPTITAGHQPSAQEITLSITATGHSTLSSNNAILHPSQLVSLSATEVQNKLISSKQIKSVTVKILPWWRTTTPDQPEKINIKLTTAEAAVSD